MKKEVEQQVTAFFREYAMKVLITAHVDPNNAHGVKPAMLDHYEQLYPAFTLTPAFKAYNKSKHHDDMVEAYRYCFSLLLQGRVP